MATIAAASKTPTSDVHKTGCPLFDASIVLILEFPSHWAGFKTAFLLSSVALLMAGSTCPTLHNDSLFNQKFK
jgi:hypothetical protein